MRYTPAYPQAAVHGIHGMLDPRRLRRWGLVTRIALACAILLAAVSVWSSAEPTDTLIATLAFAVATLFSVGTVVAPASPEPRAQALWHGLECTVDLALVTAIVHITGGWSSQFAALYILVIAYAALLLSRRGGFAIAGGACALYLVDTLWLRPGVAHLGLAVQVGVFAFVAMGAVFVAQRLRQTGVGRDELAAQLVKVQLEAADILRSIRSGIVTVDGGGRLLYANPAAAELLGVNLRALMGQSVTDTLRERAPILARALDDSSRLGVRVTRAEGIIDRDGAAIEIGVTTTTAETASSAGTSGSNATAIFQDIGDNKRLQALHIRAQRLEAVAELSASLAHEIRNPLASIRSATEQLARRSASSGDDEDEAVLHTLVVREADRLSRLLGDFLDFARPRVNRTGPVDIEALANAVAAVVASHPDRRPGIEVIVERVGTVPTYVGDDDLLHRALFNLTLNAVQAIAAVGERGRVSIHIETRDVDRVVRGADTVAGASNGAVPWPAVAITVADDGPGIPDAVRLSLWEPFVTGRRGGTGLGLPMVHRAIEAHDGVVLVDSTPRGARFTMLLPLLPGGATTDDIPARAARDAATDDLFPGIELPESSHETSVDRGADQRAVTTDHSGPRI